MLSASPGIIFSWPVPRLPHRLAAHPELELKPQSSSTLVQLDREPVDTAMRYGHDEWVGLRCERLFGEWVAPVAAPELLARMGDAGPRDLAQWPLLDNPNPPSHWRSWFQHSGGQPLRRYVANFDNLEAIGHATLQGLGVAMGAWGCPNR